MWQRPIANRHDRSLDEGLVKLDNGLRPVRNIRISYDNESPSGSRDSPLDRGAFALICRRRAYYYVIVLGQIAP